MRAVQEGVQQTCHRVDTADDGTQGDEEEAQGSEVSVK